MVLPKRFPWYPEFVPDELKRARAWVCWAERDGTKVPIIAGTTRLASHSDPKTWRSFDVACRALAAIPGRYDGVGRVICDNDPYVGIDLDDVRDPSTRELSSEAKAGLRLLDSYSEVSPSGEGVKVWVRADLPRSHKKPGVEVYRARRYFTVTGAFLAQFSPRVEERQVALDGLIASEFPTLNLHDDPKPYKGAPVELGPYLQHVEVLGEVPDQQGVKFAIRCPWAHEHSGGDGTGTYVGRRAEGGCWFSCWHAHCEGRTWREFRRYARLRTKKQRLIQKGVYT